MCDWLEWLLVVAASETAAASTLTPNDPSQPPPLSIDGGGLPVTEPNLATCATPKRNQNPRIGRDGHGPSMAARSTDRRRRSATTSRAAPVVRFCPMGPLRWAGPDRNCSCRRSTGENGRNGTGSVSIRHPAVDETHRRPSPSRTPRRRRRPPDRYAAAAAAPPLVFRRHREDGDGSIELGNLVCILFYFLMRHRSK